MTAPLRIFCGWDRRQAEAAEVFAYSVEKNGSMSYNDGFVGGRVHRIRLGAPSGPLEAQWTSAHVYVHGFKRQGTTEFSYSRFLVPFLCSYEGRAVFADGCDQLCLGDVAELAAFDLQGKPLAVVKHPAPNGKDRARSWTSLMLMDCDKLRCWTPEVVETAPDDRLMRLRDFSDAEIGELPGQWNYLVKGTVPEIFVRGRSSDVVKIAHWSYLSDPNGGSWIDRSSSALWAEWRERWRAGR